MIKYKKVWKFLLWGFGLIFLIITMGFVQTNQNGKKCKAIEIHIVEDPGNFFIDEADVKDMLSSRGKKLVGTALKDINTGMLEKIINTNPFIENAEVFSTIDGNLTISVIQRRPVLRVMNTRDEDFYIDKMGVFMPVSEKFTAPVIVANGYIFNSYSEKKLYNLDVNTIDTVSQRLMLEQLYYLATVLEKDTFWNAQVEQLYVNEWQEIEMIPRIGNHKIILGDISNLNDKLYRLMGFYKKGLNNIGWNTYHTINLKFKNQVVCSKN